MNQYNQHGPIITNYSPISSKGGKKTKSIKRNKKSKKIKTIRRYKKIQ